MLRKAILGFLILLLASGGFTAQSAVATAAPPLARVMILPVASHTDGGRSVTVRVQITCVPDGTDDILWEGAFYSIQPALDAGWVRLPCDGRPHLQDVVLYGMEVFSGDVVTVHAVLMDENNLLTIHARDTRTVRVR